MLHATLHDLTNSPKKGRDSENEVALFDFVGIALELRRQVQERRKIHIVSHLKPWSALHVTTKDTPHPQGGINLLSSL